MYSLSNQRKWDLYILSRMITTEYKFAYKISSFRIGNAVGFPATETLYWYVLYIRHIQIHMDSSYSASTEDLSVWGDSEIAYKYLFLKEEKIEHILGAMVSTMGEKGHM